MILSNQIECKSCGDRPYSAHRHDFVRCKCGEVAVDGGMDYLRRIGDANGYNELSIVWEDDLVENLVTQLVLANDNGCNELGLVCTVARVLRDNDYDVVGPIK